MVDVPESHTSKGGTRCSLRPCCLPKQPQWPPDLVDYLQGYLGSFKTFYNLSRTILKHETQCSSPVAPHLSSPYRKTLVAKMPHVHKGSVHLLRPRLHLPASPSPGDGHGMTHLNVCHSSPERHDGHRGTYHGRRLWLLKGYTQLQTLRTTSQHCLEAQSPVRCLRAVKPVVYPGTVPFCPGRVSLAPAVARGVLRTQPSAWDTAGCPCVLTLQGPHIHPKR